MGFKLSSLWGGKTPPALPAPASGGGGNSLRAAFMIARYGNTCRTLTLMHPGTGNLPCYRQIVCLGPLNGWRVLEISQQLPESGLPPKTQTRADGLDFITAIENIAQWQASQIELGYTASPGEAKNLGLSYYVAFGERENLAFDMHGQPHPTLNGEIISDGYFTDESRANARASIGTQPPVSKTTSMELFETALHPAVRPEDMDRLFDHLETQAALRDLLTVFKEMQTSLEYIFEHPIFRDPNKNKLLCNGNEYHDLMAYSFMRHNDHSQTIGRHLGNAMGYSEIPQDYFARRANDAQKLANNISIPKQEKIFLANMASAYLVVYHTLAAKYLVDLSHKVPGKRLDMVRDARSSVENAGKILTSITADNQQAWKLKAFVLEEGAVRVPASFRKFLDRYEGSLKKAEQDLRDAAKKSLTISAYQLPRPD
jgi:hypothetical protein